MGSEKFLEEIIIHLVSWVRLVIETIGASIVTFGVALSIFILLREFIRQEGISFNKIRLTLARYLALALEFQLGADILSTAISPSWEQIGKLGAIAVIRTGLNFFLMKEMQQERKSTEGEKPSVSKEISSDTAGEAG